MRARRLRGDERGSAGVELLGALPYLILAALAVWQLLLVATTVTATEHAARNGSRAATLGGDVTQAAEQALPTWLVAGATTTRAPSSTAVTVAVRVPIIVPGLASDAFVVRRDAHLPASTP